MSSQNTSGATLAHVAYSTSIGTMFHADIESFLTSSSANSLKGKVDLLFTSPPFPLESKKAYGNPTGQRYISWLSEIFAKCGELLTRSGSLVVEIGNAWEPGRPLMSTTPLKTMLAILESGNFRLCQQFISHNPARLPSPAQWVNVERVRVKDSYTHIWWMSTSDRPKADNRKILTPYSGDMVNHLNRTKTRKSTRRPSGHAIDGRSFANDNGGAIPPNVLIHSNTTWNTKYRHHCIANSIPLHPATMAPKVVEYFVRFLTDPGDLVMDPFAGSNTTGFIAESLGRRWISVEQDFDYVRGSAGYFDTVDELVDGGSRR